MARARLLTPNVAISAFKDTKSCKLILQFLQCVRMASGFSQTLALND